MERCYAQFKEALESLGDPVRAERAVIMAWFGRIKCWASYAAALASARQMRDGQRSTASLLKAALERMRPYVPAHRTLKSLSWDQLSEKIADEALPTQQAAILCWSTGARGTSACGVRPGDVRLHKHGVQVKFRVDKQRRPRAAAWKLIRDSRAVSILKPLAMHQPPEGAVWSELAPLLPKETVVRLYRLTILRDNRHEVSTVVGEIFGTKVGATLLGHSEETARGSYQDRPAAEVCAAADLLMRRDELMADSSSGESTE